MRWWGQVLQQLGVDLSRHTDDDQFDVGVLQFISGGAGQYSSVDGRTVGRQPVSQHDGDIPYIMSVSAAVEDGGAGQVERVGRVRALPWLVFQIVDGAQQWGLIVVPVTNSAWAK